MRVMIGRSLAWPALVLGLQGCGGPEGVWVKPGATAIDFERDRGDCVAEALGRTGTTGPRGRAVAMECLRRKGYDFKPGGSHAQGGVDSVVTVPESAPSTAVRPSKAQYLLYREITSGGTYLRMAIGSYASIEECMQVKSQKEAEGTRLSCERQ